MPHRTGTPPHETGERVKDLERQPQRARVDHEIEPLRREVMNLRRQRDEWRERALRAEADMSDWALEEVDDRTALRDRATAESGRRECSVCGPLGSSEESLRQDGP